MNNALKSGFPPFLNADDLKAAIESVCAEFGKVTVLKILPTGRARNRQCLCLLHVDSATTEKELVSRFSVFRSPRNLYTFVDVDEDYGRAESPTVATARFTTPFEHLARRISRIEVG